MPSFNMQKIKRRAHREALYGNAMHPFQRARTWSNVRRDVEEEGESPEVSRITSEPAQSSRGFQNTDDVISSSPNGTTADGEKFEMTHARGVVRGQEQSSEETAVESRSIGRPPSEEMKAKRRFLSNFRKRKDGDAEKSRTTTGLSTTKSSKSLKHKKFTFANQFRATILNSWINVLLVAAPVGIALHFVDGIPPVAVFVINFIAIIPLAGLLSYGTEEIALRVGETLGGLLNASFGNAVELIVSIIALVKKEYVIVKTSLIGSILSNLLLVLGMCFFFGGLRRHEQFFNITVAQTAASLLAVAVASVIIPTAFNIVNEGVADESSKIAALSRGTSVILLFVYGCYLYFQLKTHSFMYQQESQKVAMRPRKHHLPEGGILKGLAGAGGMAAAQGRVQPVDMEVPPGDEIMQRDAYELQAAIDKEEEDEPELALWVAIFTLGASTVVVAVCAEFMVDSIHAITESGVSEEFVGLILLPIVGNAAEHATAVTVAIKDKMDLAIGVAIGSSMQIALLVLPIAVLLGWILGFEEMNLAFDGFQISVLFVAILLVIFVIGDGKSNWVEGALLQSLYIIIAVTAWFYPTAKELEDAKNAA